MKYNHTRPLRALGLAGLAGIVALSVGCSPEKPRNYSRHEMPNIQEDNRGLDNSLIEQKEYSVKSDDVIEAARKIYGTQNIQKRNELLETFRKRYPTLYIQEKISETGSRSLEVWNTEPTEGKTYGDYFNENFFTKRPSESTEKKEIK